MKWKNYLYSNIKDYKKYPSNLQRILSLKLNSEHKNKEKTFINGTLHIARKVSVS